MGGVIESPMQAAARRTQALTAHLEDSSKPIGSLNLNPTKGYAAKSKPDPDREEFMRAFKAIVEAIGADVTSKFEMPTYAREWIERMVWFTTPNGKLNRGLTVLHAYRALQGSRTLSAKEVFRANALGWCIEFLQAFFLVSDDIMDSSKTRRGKPCWYLYKHPLSHGSDEKHKVGMIAINDAIILESCIFLILKRYFREDKIYLDLVDLFHEVTWQTELGQLLDTTTQPPGDKVDLRLYTIETYKRVVKYKTAFYSFYLPIACAMLLSGIENAAAFKEARDILLPMGEYFQIQDDYLDCYGAPEVIGKIGTDIQDAKCSWLVVQALDRADARQKKLIEEHYGKDNEKDIAVIKKVFVELGLEGVYKKYEEESFHYIKALIEKATLVPKAAYLGLFNKIYKREA